MHAWALEDIRRRIDSAWIAAKSESGNSPSRELSLVITKLEEASMWLEKIQPHGDSYLV